MSNNTINKNAIPYSIIAKFGYDTIGRSGENEIIYRCPECINRKGTPDLKGKLYVNTKSLKYHCFRCDYSGTINTNNINHDKIYEEDIEEDVSSLIHNINNALSDTPKYSLKIPIKSVVENESATKYLLDRGFTIEQMKYYDMRSGNLNQEFGRIIIPNIVDHKVYTDMYSARSYIGQIPKYHNPSQIKKSEIVFNLHRIKDNTPIILVEGALTAVAAGYHAVASLGKNLSISQASQIAMKHPSVIYVNYDYGAEKNSHDACKMLYSIDPGIPIYEVLMTDDRDAADMSRMEYIQCINNAVMYNPLKNDLLNLLSQ